jgi:hypothetical protein
MITQALAVVNNTCEDIILLPEKHIIHKVINLIASNPYIF